MALTYTAPVNKERWEEGEGERRHEGTEKIEEEGGGDGQGDGGQVYQNKGRGDGRGDEGGRRGSSDDGEEDMMEGEWIDRSIAKG